ncbi:MAG: type IV pilus twitching motility protein PilT, partial [Solirubrobacterales bacterium]
MFNLDDALRYLVENGGSDLHMKVPMPPSCRMSNGLLPIPGTEKLMPDDTEAALEQMASEKALAEFAESGEADFPHSIPNLARFRVNAFRQRGSVSIVCRAIPYGIKTIDELDLPDSIRKLAEEERGLILVTGTTGSGKSTTLAAMIDHINSTMRKHIITLEDPIEYLHRDKLSLINQREVGIDTESFDRALRRILRQDPDAILIGEMRDEETVRTALSAAETGHLVLSTLHTIDAAETVNRIIDFFPPHHQEQARVMLSATLRGAISQRLVPTPDGNGRVGICEVLISTGRVEDLILNPKETGKITEVIAEGGYCGMQTFDQALLKRVKAGQVALDDAMKVASSPHDFQLMLDTTGDEDGDSAGEAPVATAAPTVSAPAPPMPSSAPNPEPVGAAVNGNGNGAAAAAPAPAPATPAARPPAPQAPAAPAAQSAPPVAPPAAARPPAPPPA